MSTAEVAVANGPVRCTREEYLARERATESKSEYYNGEMWPTTGASQKHTFILVSLIRLLGTALRGTAVRVLAADMRVLVGANYFYPDVVLAEKPIKTEDEFDDSLLDPVAVIEILSPSTEKFDRGKKFEAYQAVASIREYVLVSQDVPRIDHYRRSDDDPKVWKLTVSEGLESSVQLLENPRGNLVCRLNLSEVYEDVDFSIPSPTKVR